MLGTPSGSSVLVVDENAALATSLRSALSVTGIDMARIDRIEHIAARLRAQDFHALIVNHEANTRARTLADVRSRWPEMPLIAVVPMSEPGATEAALRSGATECLRAPIDEDEAVFVINKVLTSSRIADSDVPQAETAPGTELIGGSPPMQVVHEMIRRAAKSRSTVLIRGESGTGKELVARRVHELSANSRSPFIKVHCAALPEQLLESELFGYEKGAFTGAVARKPGRFELAENGTIFLDEIGDITLAMQVKLLRVLQDREFERVGGTKTMRLDARFVAATHRNLEQMVKNGSFREDLYYRLNVVPIHMPRLRDRRGDVRELCVALARRICQSNGRAPVVIDEDALQILERNSWPGNVRQLHNFIERVIVLRDGPTVSASDVEEELGRELGAATAAEPTELSVVELSVAVKKAERAALNKALRRADGNRNLAARLLGVSKRTLFYKLKEYGIE